MDDERGFISRLLASRLWREAPVWIVLASLVFLVVVNYRYIKWLP